jgi:ribosomal peptide maturation radical SAM protein 1
LCVRQHGEIQIHEEDREIDVLPSQAAPRQQHSECGPETAATAVHVLRIGNPAAARTPVGPVTMDDVPLPVYDEYFARLAHSPLEKQLDRVWVPYESSRGCWWAVKKVCTFCAANAQYVTFRSRAPARVAADVEQLAQRYGTRYVWFVDNIMDERYLREVFPRMPGARDRLSMFVETRAHVSRAQLEKMRDAGVEIVQLGVESFSSPILRLIDKGTTGLQNIRVIKWCAELGIQAFYNVIYGFPGEPPDEYERMANLVPALSHLEPPKDPVPLRLDRYSPYHRDPDRYGIEVTGVRPSRPLVFDRDPSELEDIEYFFTFGYRDRREPNRYAARFIEACRMWRAGWRRDGATLTWGNSSAGMQICDRRRVVVPIHYDLATAESAIYRACDAGATAAAAHAALFPADQRDITVREVEAFLVRLVGLRLMYREGSRFLALAVSHPNISMSQASDGESPNSGSVVPLRLMTLPEVRQCHEEHGR